MSNACRVAVLVSGSGSNLEALFLAHDRGELSVEIVLVLSSRPDAFALVRAQKRAVPNVVIDPADFLDEPQFQQAILDALRRSAVDVVCLAGYMRKLSPEIVHEYRGRMLNIHPALLPKFGGTGMYGRRVHEAVLKAGEKESGCSVHLVDEEFDHGSVIAQAKVPVLSNDTVQSLSQRVLEQEHLLYPATLETFCRALQRNVPS